MIGRISTAIGEAGGIIDTIDLVSRKEMVSIRELVIEACSEEHQREIICALERIDNVYLIAVEDLTIKHHIGGINNGIA